jgi:hypothetical protein
MAKPKKPLRFPRKFRQKLEKMRVDRGEEPDPGRTLVMDFLGQKTVKFMHAVLDDTSHDPREWKLRVRHTLDENRTRWARDIKTTEHLPPWETEDETPASE